MKSTIRTIEIVLVWIRLRRVRCASCHNESTNEFSSSSVATRELDIENESSKGTGLPLKRIFSLLFGNTMLMSRA